MNRSLFLLLIGLVGTVSLRAAESKLIRIATASIDLVLGVSAEGRLYQAYLGPRLENEADLQVAFDRLKVGSDSRIPLRGWEVCAASGAEDYFEPAFALTHNDGTRTMVFKYLSCEERSVTGGTETVIRLREECHPVDLTLHYVAYPRENVIKSWSELTHQQRHPVVLSRYASTLLFFSRTHYYLTEFSGSWGDEAQASSQPLLFGKKIVDSRLGTRAAMYAYPFFELGLDSPVAEQQGEVLMGTIGWTGNFRFTFEIDQLNNLRVVPSINPDASEYRLRPHEVFTTPEFIFTLSPSGTALGSRNLQAWARRYQLKDGAGDRLTLLNNWENTGFSFDEKQLAHIMHEAGNLGVDMFLLDDGWFGNKYPRCDDKAGLGDWEPTRDKLPGGIPALVSEARKNGVRFGIWIEPEMVNPRSELFEKHPDWAYLRPDREPYYFRNQLALDLCNPAVQDHVFGVVDRLMKENPDLAFMKWDCNSTITNLYSSYLKNSQSQLYIDHVRGLYRVLDRVKERYPDLPLMLCSGGGARCDYQALKYFTEFWCSDNTDPIARLYIQWGFSQFFPAKALCAHVTSWNKQASIKFRVDVASMCKLGFDLGLKDLSEAEIAFCRQAIQAYNRLKPIILDGEQYRLYSPYEGQHMAVMYREEEGRHGVLFAYDLLPRYQEKLRPVCLQGLDPKGRYRLREINLMPGEISDWADHEQAYSGDYLMKAGLYLFTDRHMHSRVIEIVRED